MFNKRALLKSGVSLLLGSKYSQLISSLTDDQRQMIASLFNTVFQTLAEPERLKEFAEHANSVNLADIGQVFDMADQLGLLDVVESAIAPSGPSDIMGELVNLSCPHCGKPHIVKLR